MDNPIKIRASRRTIPREGTRGKVGFRIEHRLKAIDFETHHHENLGEEGDGDGSKGHGPGKRVKPLGGLPHRHEELVLGRVPPPPPPALPLSDSRPQQFTRPIAGGRPDRSPRP